MASNGWIGVDLDGTLAHYEGWKGYWKIGEPIQPMVDRVKEWLAEGRKVKIFTARMAQHGKTMKNGRTMNIAGPIEKWCEKHIGQKLEVTNIKDMQMRELWDDRAIQVELNTGKVIGGPQRIL